MPFPADFLWGAATSSYQVEGAVHADGRGDSVWDMLCRRPGAIELGEHGYDACDHYNRLEEDLDLIAGLGLKAYRFSIAWPRVMPDGTGSVNEAGLGFYDRLVDGLVARGVEPIVTLFHWDYPMPLFQRGGWLNPASPGWFADYTTAVVARLSDRVTRWVTLNEPQCFIGLGHEVGEHAPGLQLSIDQVLLAAHHALLAHGRSVDAIREHARRDPKVSWAPVAVTCFPDSDSPEDIEAARHATFDATSGETEAGALRTFVSGLWFDAAHKGHYPESALRAYGEAMPKVKPGEMEQISRPLDYLGLNLYHGTRVKAGPDGSAVPVPQKVGAPTTRMGWPITPESIYWMAKFFYERYQIPLIVTENGRAESDYVGVDGKVHDPLRIEYLNGYIGQLERAIDEGVPVEGYCVWSLMDNFEWARGYGPRFGMIHVDFETFKRTPKDSYHWYRNVIERNGLGT